MKKKVMLLLMVCTTGALVGCTPTSPSWYTAQHVTAKLQQMRAATRMELYRNSIQDLNGGSWNNFSN
ncbi:hypothetical protein F6A13_03590 [Acidithiobacillus sp. 'AMD consortium']|uniref:hypothetical protein n=1 Tax=Acidithiobacillus sp. 'AMD consortium' TaxID=2614801 RepID=UPI00124EE11D|nr:hypothetical protein [Acidithiobacillus sp. 'AMD consortium']QFG77819.1 hypothetical protein F6A13_03590 [Acidithiobacillus sp. 'AMD consortium']